MTDDELRAIADLCARVLNRMELFDAEVRRLRSSLDQFHRDHADIRRLVDETRAMLRERDRPPGVL